VDDETTIITARHCVDGLEKVSVRNQEGKALAIQQFSMQAITNWTLLL
jgi:hypothetical protein